MKNISKLPPWVLLRKLGRLLFFATYKSLYYWLAISGFIVVVLIAGFYLAPGFMFHQLLQPAQQHPPLPTIGNMNGIRLSIPYGYRQFPMEYEDESVWERKKEYPLRTFDSRINNFSIHVQWPTLEPRSSKNEASFLHSSNTVGAHEWLVVGAKARPPIFHPKIPSNRLTGLAGILSGRLHKPEQYGMPPNFHYENQGFDTSLKLHVATPVGLGVKQQRYLWNKAVFWSGEIRNVTTLILCDHDQGDIPEWIARCEHKYEIPELNAVVSVNYTGNLLPQWREIETKTTQLIMSFKEQAKGGAH